MDILVAYDFSPAAESALAWAAQLHAAVGGRMHVLHVLEPPPVTSAGPPYLVVVTDVPDPQAIRHELNTHLSSIGCDATCEVMSALDAARGVLARAQSWGATLVVQGTHGRRGLSRLVLGSVAEGVVRQAHCPVVTVRGTR